MKIYTSYFANKRKLEADGIVMVGICIYPPRYFRGANVKELAPTKKIFEMSSAPDEIYVPAFKQEVLSKVDARAVRDKLERISGGRDVAICCYEKNVNECHRKIVGEWLAAELGIEVPEFGQEKQAVTGDLFG